MFANAAHQKNAGIPQEGATIGNPFQFNHYFFDEL
jgi:hypothetical protein